MSNNSKGTPRDVLVLQLTRDPWRLEIGGTLQDIDLAIAVVEQAKRYFETQAHLAAMMQQAKMAEDAELAQSIIGRKQ